MQAITPCLSLDEVRQQIDRLDRQLLALVGERSAYVAQAAALKKDRAEVAAPQRVEQVISRLCAMAKDYGAPPKVVEATWRTMIAAFIRFEQQTHSSLHTPAPSP